MASLTSTVPLRWESAIGATPIPSSRSYTFCFGRFRLDVRERLLLKDDAEVNIGSRAFDLLLALVERAGETVNRKDLFERVWPDVIVAKVNLRVHIAGLRKLLRDGQDGNRFIVSVACRGYSFVAPVSRIQPSIPAARLPRYTGAPLPSRAGQMFAALAIVHTGVIHFEGALCRVDLSGINDPARVATAVAAALQCEVDQHESLTGLVTLLKNREMLLAFDNCDHVFTGVAQLTERLINEAPFVHVLIGRRKSLHSSDGPVSHG